MKIWNNEGDLDIDSETPDGAVVQKFANDSTSRICLREKSYIVKPFISTWSSF